MIESFAESKWEEARKGLGAVGESLGLTSTDEIDVIWAMSQDRRARKGKKKVSSRGNKQRRIVGENRKWDELFLYIYGVEID